MKRRIGYAVGALVVANAVLLACSGGDTLGAAGEACQVAADCAPGLICVPSGSTKVCSNDLSGVTGDPPGGGDDETDASVSAEAAVDSSSTKKDASDPDDSGIPITDAGTVTDTGVVQDTGVIVDTGVVVDTGVIVDTGVGQ